MPGKPKYLILLLIAATSLLLTACGKSQEICLTPNLVFVNTSTDTYNLYLDNIYYQKLLPDAHGAVAGYNDTVNYYTGTCTVRVLQVSGYSVTPTSITKTGNLNCGQNVVITFP